MSDSVRTVLLFAAKLGYQTRSFNDAANRLGVRLAFVTDRCHELEDPWRDRAIAVSFQAPQEAGYAAAAAMREARVAGILALGDAPTVAAAHAAQKLGLVYNDPGAAAACRSKLRMRERFERAGLPSPWFHAISLERSAESAPAGIRFPCVLKPMSLSASQGVMRVNNREEFFAGAARLRLLLEAPEMLMRYGGDAAQMLVEEYLPGQEVAVEGLLRDGELRVLAIFDKPDPLEGPFFEETIYVTPSRLPANVQSVIEKRAAQAVRALGLKKGPVHAEFRVNDAEVWPLEVAPRPIGGLCAGALRFRLAGSSATVSLEELLLRHVLEEDTEQYEREPDASAVMMIPVPASGVLARIDGVDEAQRVPGITACHITARLHDFMAAWPEGSSYLGFLFARAASPGEAERALRVAHEKLKFTMETPLPVRHPVTGRVHERV